MVKNGLFSSESVTEGHPDKVCDQISDGILDKILDQDPNARVACEALATTGVIYISGEITTTAEVDYSKIALNILKEIGYSSDFGVDLDTIKIFNSQYNYLADPHTATGLSVLYENNYDHPVISLACAHPAKFGNAIKKSIDIDILLPKVLENIFDKKENMHILNNNSEDIKRFILKNI